MKNSLHYTYCTLLFVSLLSSCLLFILVASEKPLKASTSYSNTETKKASTTARIKTTNHHFNSGFSSKKLNSFEELLRRSHERRLLLRNKKNVFKEVVPHDFMFLDVLSKNAGITNGLKELPGAPTVINLVDTQNDLKFDNRLEEDIQATLENITNNLTSTHKEEDDHVEQAVEQTTSLVEEFEKLQEVRKEIENVNTNMDQASEEAVDVKEDGKPEVNLTEEKPIPVFSEWTQKQMEEAQKKKDDVVNASTMKKSNKQPGNKLQPLKLRAKNYAAPDCGAKILASNAEAQSTASVLTALKDEYLLNPCTSRIWFVVELCEPIQAERIELANFELFSSSPKDFTIGVANRFPTRDWSNVGQYMAKDERDVQSFNLHPKLFGKFIRVDIHSHYNSEHYCPVSLFRVYGTSEFEAFETDNQPNANEDDDDEDDEDEHEEEAVANKIHIVNTTKKNNLKDQNLLKSAGEAVMNIVKKAAEVLVKTNDKKDRNNCICLVHQIKCEKCSEKLREKVKHILECQYDFISSLHKIDIINRNLEEAQYYLCANIYKADRKDFSLKQKKSFLNMLPDHYIAGLCNIRAFSLKRKSVISEKVKVNAGEKVVTQTEHFTETSTENASIYNQVRINQKQDIDVKESTTSSTLSPTQTTGSLENDETNKIVDEHINDVNIFNVIDNVVSLSPDVVTNVLNSKEESYHQAVPPPVLPSIDKDESNQLWDSIDENLLDQQIDSPSSNNQQIQQQSQQKVQPDSVFLRLSNRIKALERNMSLSGQYLEELSRRYKKQVEELQYSFTKTLSSIEEQNRRNVEREQYLREENLRLRQELYDFMESVTNWQNIVFYAGFLICIQVVLLYTFLKNCPKKTNQNLAIEDVSQNFKPSQKASIVRRKSVDDMMTIEKINDTNNLKVKRPSEEALNITAGTYTDLLITESTDQIIECDFVKKKKKKEKHRKISAPQLSQSVVNSQAFSIMNRPSFVQKMELVRSESVPVREIPSPSTLNTPIYMDGDRIEQLVLDDHDEFIVPSAAEFAYDEFVPICSSETIENINGGSSIISSTSSMESKSASKSKFTRRLSSPKIGSFLRNSISSRRSEKTIDENENDDSGSWFKLKKSSSHEKAKRKAVSESPSISLNGFNTTPPPLSQKKSGGSFKSYSART